MTKNQLKVLARRFSYPDWCYICRDARSFNFLSMEPAAAQTVAQTILLEHDAPAPIVDTGPMQCKDCGHEFEGDRQHSRCPQCTSNRTTIPGRPELMPWNHGNGDLTPT